MRNLTDDLKVLTAHRGLYRIWVQAVEGQRTVLVARWIDPEAESDKREQTSSRDKEARTPWSGTNSRAA